MKSSSLALSFVVTTCAVACAQRTNNPPGPMTVDGTSEPPEPAPQDTTEQHTTAPKPGDRLNAEDGDGRTIYVTKAGCWVNIAQGPPLPDTPPAEKVPCPKTMTGPAWQQCLTGEIELGAGACICHEGGNPPPPPREVDCPEL